MGEKCDIVIWFTFIAFALDVKEDLHIEYLNEFALIAVEDDLIDEAIALDPVLGGADSVHVSSALRLGVDKVTIVTHDAQMAGAAVSLGFDVLDPVTDNPNRPAII